MFEKLWNTKANCKLLRTIAIPCSSVRPSSVLTELTLLFRCARLYLRVESKNSMYIIHSLSINLKATESYSMKQFRNHIVRKVKFKRPTRKIKGMWFTILENECHTPGEYPYVGFLWFEITSGSHVLEVLLCGTKIHPPLTKTL